MGTQNHKSGLLGPLGRGRYGATRPNRIALWLPSLLLGGFVVPWHVYTCFVGYDGTPLVNS